MTRSAWAAALRAVLAAGPGAGFVPAAASRPLAPAGLREAFAIARLRPLRRRVEERSHADAWRVVLVRLLGALIGAGATVGSLPATGLVKSGTGFIVSSPGRVVTAAHVVSGCARISLWQRNGPRRRARLLATDSIRDIALLQTDAPFAPDMAPPRLGAGAPGETVYLVGYGVYADRPRAPVALDGVFIGRGWSSSGSRVDIVHAAAGWQSGESGSPVLAADGRLVGMVIGRDAEWRDRGVVVPASEIRKFLERRGLPVAEAGGANGLPLREQLLAIAVLVQCLPGSASRR